jgi:hypothetical protein
MCGHVDAASNFETLDFGSNWGPNGMARRQCPSCAAVLPTADFTVVREDRATEDEVTEPPTPCWTCGEDADGKFRDGSPRYRHQHPRNQQGPRFWRLLLGMRKVFA